jgi:hypothetical protein
MQNYFTFCLESEAFRGLFPASFKYSFSDEEFGFVLSHFLLEFLAEKY